MPATQLDADCPVQQTIVSTEPTFSVEVYAPRSDDEEQSLWATVHDLAELGSRFVSVTYGAGGTGTRRTLPTVQKLRDHGKTPAVAHLTAAGASAEHLRQELESFKDAGVSSVLALRGDPPTPDAAWEPHPEGFRYASELVELALEVGGMTIGVAAFPHAHPDSASVAEDRKNLATKLAAGADFAMSQHFFDPNAFLNLRDDMSPVSDAAIVPGLIPITTPRLLRRAEILAGVELTGPWAERLSAVENDPVEFRKLGIAYTAEVTQNLLAEGVAHIHFYTLNRATATTDVARATGLA